MSGSSIPRYPYRSACAFASSRAQDEGGDSSDMWSILGLSSVMCDWGVKRGVFYLPEQRFDRSDVIMRFRDDSLRGRGGVGGITSEAGAGAGGPADK